MKVQFRMLLLLVVMSLVLSACAPATAPAAPAAEQAAAQPAADTAATSGEKIQVRFWYGLGGELGEVIETQIKKFNESQDEIEVVGVFQQSYNGVQEKFQAALVSGDVPELVQIEIHGTPKFASAGALTPLEPFMENDPEFNFDDLIPAGLLNQSWNDTIYAMPINRSTPVLYYNKAMFEEAGVEPPTTWQGVVEAARAIKARNAAPIPMTTAWPTWVHFEQYGAMHNLPFATKGNGFDGLDTELRINAPAYAKHLQRLLDMGKEGLFRWGGRDNAAEPLFVSGEAAIQFTSSAGRAAIARDAKFNWAMALLPTDPEVNPNPINSVIGGASIWTMTAPNRTLAEYRAVANFFAYISQPAVDAEWHQRTGYVPVTSAAYEVSKGQGFYQKTPGTDLPILQLSRGQLSENSRGFRLGRMVELRNIIQEEMERALQGQQTAQAALDSAVQRGNRVLREFERTARG